MRRQQNTVSVFNLAIALSIQILFQRRNQFKRKKQNREGQKRTSYLDSNAPFNLSQLAWDIHVGLVNILLFAL